MTLSIKGEQQHISDDKTMHVMTSKSDNIPQVSLVIYISVHVLHIHPTSHATIKMLSKQANSNIISTLMLQNFT